VKVVDKLFNCRHSFRQFSGTLGMLAGNFVKYVFVGVHHTWDCRGSSNKWQYAAEIMEVSSV